MKPIPKSMVESWEFAKEIRDLISRADKTTLLYVKALIEDKLGIYAKDKLDEFRRMF